MLAYSLRLQDFMKDHVSFRGNFHPQLEGGQSDLICSHLSSPRAVLWVVQLSLKVARNFWQDLKFEKHGPSRSQLTSLSSTAQHDFHLAQAAFKTGPASLHAQMRFARQVIVLDGTGHPGHVAYS